MQEFLISLGHMIQVRLLWQLSLPSLRTWASPFGSRYVGLHKFNVGYSILMYLLWQYEIIPYLVFGVVAGTVFGIFGRYKRAMHMLSIS
jgi:hypothetical protein